MRHQQISRSSGTRAVRSAGTYYGPEIQGCSFDFASRGTDVWSLGCIALMMMAFTLEGKAGVFNLRSKLAEQSMSRGRGEHLFYVRYDTDSWNIVSNNRYRNSIPEVANVPGMYHRQAAIHPQVIAWSNMIYRTYRPSDTLPGRPLVKAWFEVIFRSALLVDHRKRSRAIVLRDKLRAIQEEWQLFERSPANFQVTDSKGGLQSLRPLHLSEEMPALQPHSVPGQPAFRRIFAAINEQDILTMRYLLKIYPNELEKAEPRLDDYPIHYALKQRSYEAFGVLLEYADRNVTNLESRGRTVLELATEHGGDVEALKRIRKHADKFLLTPYLYDARRRNLTLDARMILDDVYKVTKAVSTKESFLDFWGKSRSDTGKATTVRSDIVAVQDGLVSHGGNKKGVKSTELFQKKPSKANAEALRFDQTFQPIKERSVAEPVSPLLAQSSLQDYGDDIGLFSTEPTKAPTTDNVSAHYPDDKVHQAQDYTLLQPKHTPLATPDNDQDILSGEGGAKRSQDLILRSVAAPNGLEPIFSLSLPLLVDKILWCFPFPNLQPAVPAGQTRVHWTSVSRTCDIIRRHSDRNDRAARSSSTIISSWTLALQSSLKAHYVSDIHLRNEREALGAQFPDWCSESSAVFAKTARS